MTQLDKAVDFHSYIEKPLAVKNLNYSLVLRSIEEPMHAGHSPEHRSPFTLVFWGPPGAVLPAGVYTLEGEDAAPFELHITPIGHDRAKRPHYQACFN